MKLSPLRWALIALVLCMVPLAACAPQIDQGSTLIGVSTQAL